MITLLLIILILVASLSSNINSTSNLAFNISLTRLSSITLIFSSFFLIINVLYFDIINNGISIYSGFIQLDIITFIFQFLLNIVSGIILASIITNRYLYLKNKTTQTLVLLNSHNYFNNYTLIVLFNIIGASTLMFTNDTLLLYIVVELQSFSLYILSALKNDSVFSVSAGLKYFLIGSLASVIILLGIALLYYATGLTNFEDLYLYLNISDFFSTGGFEAGLSNQSPFVESLDLWNFTSWNSFYLVIILSFILIITGIFIKLGAAPFHQWALDVYSLVPTPITTWLVTIPKISLFVFLFHILEIIIGTGNSLNYGGYADFLYNLLENSKITNAYNNNSELLEQIELLFFENNLGHFKNIFGEATVFYPHFLQIELMNSYNSPIINESLYYRYDNIINTIWNTYHAPTHNLIAYFVNIITLGSLTITNFLIFIAILSLIIGSIGGIYQIKIKRLLALSSISQLGFLIIALSINNKISLESFMFYLTQYIITSLNIFIILFAFAQFIYSLPLTNLYLINNKNKINLNLSTDIDYINQLIGWFKTNSVLALSFIISIFSLIGIPPLPGFFAKQMVLLSSLSVGFIFISIIAILTSVISAFYYLRLINTSVTTESYFKHFVSFFKISQSKTQPTEFFNNNSNLNFKPSNNLLNINLPIVFSYSISFLTLCILVYSIKADMVNKFFSICSFYFYSL